MYNVTAYEIIKRALTTSGIVGVEQPISAVDMATGIETLNYLIQGYMAQGLHLWKQEDAVLFLQKGQRSYKIGAGGDKSCYKSALTATRTTSDQSSGSFLIDAQSVAGLSAPAEILNIDPSITVTGWTATDATISLNGGFLEVTNDAAANGSASYALETEVGKSYRVIYGYLSGTSASADFSILDSLGNVLVTANQTVSSSYAFDFTATESSHRFEIKNGSAALGETSQLNYLNYLDLDSGDFVGVKLADGSRFWTTIEEINATTITLRDAITADSSANTLVYSYPQDQQLKRPLNVDDIRYSFDVTQNEIPVQKITRNQDRMQPLKLSEGIVTWLYYNPKLSLGQVEVWQTPASSDSVCQFTSIDPFVVTVDTVDQVDIPAYWVNAIRWNLANEFVTEYNIPEPRASRIMQMAAVTLQEALDYDDEKTSLYVVPVNHG